MGKKEIINLILNENCFIKKPPVLFDIGSSGDVKKIWEPIMKYSICVAFDPDDRDLQITRITGKHFKEFYLINKAVSDKNEKTKFYLTKSPHCSSTLKPNLLKLKYYDIASYFKVEKEIMIETITINDVLNNLKLDYLDWYKTDTQGTDLRIYKKIDENISRKIIVAEFEPGILDAYESEDKLYSIMEYFDKKNFFCDECLIRGMHRITEDFKNRYFNNVEKRFFDIFSNKVAFWAEISYFNNFDDDFFDKRDFLLGIVFAILKKQYGFILELTDKGIKKFGVDKLFSLSRDFAIKEMKKEGWIKLFPYILRKLYNKIL